MSDHTFHLDERGRIITDLATLPDVAGAYRPNSVIANSLCFGKTSLAGLSVPGKKQICKILTQPSMVCVSQSQSGGQLTGWSTQLSYMSRRCGCNALRAMIVRHGMPQVKTTDDFPRAVKAYGEVCPEVRRFYELLSVSGRQGWMDHWSGVKRNLIEKSTAFDEPKPSHVKLAVKGEGGPAPPSRPRGIQGPMNMATQAVHGPSVWYAQKAFCRVFNRKDLGGGIDVTIASGMNAKDLGRWMDYVHIKGPKSFYECDGKSWDSTINHKHLAFKIAVLAQVDPVMALEVAKGVKVKGFGKYKEGVLRYVLDGTVKSGHNDTSLGNGIIRSALSFEIFSILRVSCSILVTGDDLLVACYDEFSCSDAERLELSLGITPVARKILDARNVSFASGVFFLNRGAWEFLPKPGRLLSKLWWADKHQSQRQLPAYRRGVALGLLPSCGGMPIVGTWLRKFCGEGVVTQTKKCYIFHDCHVDWDTDIVQVFADRYLVTPQAIIECEEYLMKLPAEPLIIIHPVLERIVEVDLAELHDRWTH